VHDIQAQLALTSVANRLRAQVEAHRALQAPVADGPMDLADYIGQLCACLARAPLAENGMWLRVTADEVWLDADRCWRVGLAARSPPPSRLCWGIDSASCNMQQSTCSFSL
jgi:hypothetical protein